VLNHVASHDPDEWTIWATQEVNDALHPFIGELGVREYVIDCRGYACVIEVKDSDLNLPMIVNRHLHRELDPSLTANGNINERVQHDGGVDWLFLLLSEGFPLGDTMSLYVRRPGT